MVSYLGLVCWLRNLWLPCTSSAPPTPPNPPRQATTAYDVRQSNHLCGRLAVQLDFPQAINLAATTLDVSPRVQQPEETATGIALALSALGLAGEAACVAHGVQLLQTYSDDPSCAARAAQFTNSNKEKYKNLPSCFWDLFADLGAHVVGSGGGRAAFVPISGPAEARTPKTKAKSETARSDLSPGTLQSTTDHPNPSPVKSEAASEASASASQFAASARTLKRRKMS